MKWRERLVRFRSFWIFPILACSLLYVGRRLEPARSYLELSWLVPLGLASWTLLEYGLHRFIFHMNNVHELVSGSHRDHHTWPRDGDLILVHTWYGLFVSATAYFAIFAVMQDAFRAAGMMSGIWAGFLYYESVHYRVHMTNASSVVLTKQRRSHFHHHFRDPTRCFGVTTPVWDYIFGTAGVRD